MRIILALLMCVGIAFGQDTTKYFKSTDYGWNWQRGKFRGGLILPTDTTNNKLGIAQIGGSCFAWNGSKWAAVGATDTTFLIRYYRKNQVDSAISANSPALTLQDITNNGNTTTDSIIALAFKRTGGTSSQFLKANGSVDNSTYLTSAVTSIATTFPILGGTITTTGNISADTGRGNNQLATGGDLIQVKDSLAAIIATKGSGTVTSVSALTLGTSGTDLSSTVANGTTTPVITLNVPTASATNRGVLSSTDWTTFNNKQVALNGTGFVKATGTTISYDNSTYLTTSSAASTYFPLTGGALTGTGGNGYVGYILQSTRPATPANGFRLFADSLGRLSWIGSNGYSRVFDGTSNTANRTYTLPDASGTFPLLGSTQTFTGLNTFTATATASGAIARGGLYNPTLTAAANSDVLVGLDVNSTFTNGAFTGVNNINVRASGWSQFGTTNGTSGVIIGPTGFSSGSPNTGLRISANLSSGQSIYNNGAGNGYYHDFQTGSTLRFTIRDGGVGVLTSTITDAFNVVGNINLQTAGNKIKIATGTNASVGTATLSSGTITVSTTAVTASSIILLTLQNCSNCGTPYISAKTAGTSFVINSTNVLDGSIVAYQIIN